MYNQTIRVNVANGIHTRIAAMIVHTASKIKDKYDINLYIKKSGSSINAMAISMLALISLKINEDELIEISAAEDSIEAEKAVDELCNFITTGLGNSTNMDKIDAIIEQNNIANEQIFKSLPVGIIVIDANSYITTINEYALNLIEKKLSEVLGKNIGDIIPTSELTTVIINRQKQIGKIQHINNHIVIVNRSPIISKNEIIGAVGVFQDISEVVGMRELNEKFKKILEASHDLICFVDEDKKISYINPAYEKHLGLVADEIIGKSLDELSPKGFRMNVYNSKTPLENIVHKKNDTTIISNIEPIFIDNYFKGVISISKAVDEIKDIVSKLEQSQAELNYYKDELKRHTKLNGNFIDIIGGSDSLRDSIIIADKAANSTSTVLIRGESGTGKELIAKAIHDNSARKDKPFVRVNCAAIPENLLESELFGYEKGAFTGAVQSKPGKFNIANSGTIFLDEIGDMPKAMQAKLLRALQEKEFESVGGIVTQKVDVRVIAATNRNLEEMISSGDFRDDLYYRLNVITISLPPLRNRKEDINALVDHFIKKINLKLEKNITGIDKDCLTYLEEYHWPGNIRELENTIERAINMCDGEVITSKDLPIYLTNIREDGQNLINLRNGELLTLEDYEKELIAIAMKKYKSFNKAGQALGLTHRTVALKCKKYGIIS